MTAALWTAVVLLLMVAANGGAPSGHASAPPAGRSAHGAAGTALNGFGGVIAPSPTSASWPGTGAGRNGGPFAFIGAHYGPLWGIPPGPNNSRGVGYCIMEDVAGEGTVAVRPEPAAWDRSEQARAGALMSTFGGDRVVPYGIDASGAYDVASGEWRHPSLLGAGEYTRRRQVAVNFGVKMFVEDVSPSGATAGRKLARDTAVINGTGGDFAALRNGYAVAQHIATVADRQHAIGGVRLTLKWSTPDGAAPTVAGTYPLEVRATDSTGKAVGFVPVIQLSDVGIDQNRSVGTLAVVDNRGDSPDDLARWNAASASKWPTWNMVVQMATDPRFVLGSNPKGADVTDAAGIARFTVTIPGPNWELAFHTQAPTGDVALYSGTGVQGQITWEGRPQSASVHQVVAPPPPPPPPPPPVGEFRIRKVLDQTDIQGDRDMSGFRFEVFRGDGSAGSPLEGMPVVTGSDGRTPTIEAAAGSYTIVEVGQPGWAAGLTDGGAVTFTYDPSTSPVTVDIEYRNHVPNATIESAARDALDGDRFVMLGDNDAPTTRIIDTITYTGLVPGTAYDLRGELMILRANDDAAGSGIRGTARFTPATADGSIDVAFDVPFDVAATTSLIGETVVAYQRLAVASSGRVVATHEDPDAAAQTIRFPAITTHLAPDWPAGDGAQDRLDSQRSTESTESTELTELTESTEPAGIEHVFIGDALVDTIAYEGFEPHRRYRAELTLHARGATGECAPTDIATSVEFTPDASTGEIAVDGISAPTAGTFVAFERVFALEPDGTSRLVALHEDCAEQRQTVHAVAPPEQPPPSPSTTTTTTTTTTTPTPTTTVPPSPTTTIPAPKPLPRTGGGTSGSMIGTALALLLMGVGLALLARPLRSND